MQADGLKTVLPNAQTDPAFAAALDAARRAGVQILYLPCHVEPDRLEIIENSQCDIIGCASGGCARDGEAGSDGAAP